MRSDKYEFPMLPLRAFLRIGGRMVYCDSGGDEPKAPDNSALIAASNRQAELAAELGRAQLAESTRQYENNMKIAAPVVEAQLGLMTSQKEHGDAYYKDYNETYKPINQSLAKDAAEFNTDAAKEKFAGQAAADAGVQQANQDAQQTRALSAMGVNPNSGKFAALSSQNKVLNAASRAGATTNARTTAEDIAWNKRMQVAGLGSALVTASQNSYNGASNNGTSAVANNAQAGNSLVAGTNAANATTLSGGAAAINGLSSALNSSTSTYNANLNANSNAQAGMGSLIGAGIGAAASIYAKSDRRTKENIVQVGVDEETGLNLYEFNYVGDGRRFRGVMADEVEGDFPEAVAYDADGMAKVDYSALGLDMVELAA